MNLRTILFSQYPALFLLAVLFYKGNVAFVSRTRLGVQHKAVGVGHKEVVGAFRIR